MTPLLRHRDVRLGSISAELSAPEATVASPKADIIEVGPSATDTSHANVRVVTEADFRRLSPSAGNAFHPGAKVAARNLETQFRLLG